MGHRFMYVYLDFRSFRIQALMTRISYSKYTHLVDLNWYPVEYKHRNCARVDGMCCAGSDETPQFMYENKCTVKNPFATDA
jgi:hypothetical protein